jgi:hypothetical protein
MRKKEDYCNSHNLEMEVIHNLGMSGIKYKIANLILLSLRNSISIAMKPRIKSRRRRIKKAQGTKKMLSSMSPGEMRKGANNVNSRVARSVIIMPSSMTKTNTSNHQHQARAQSTARSSSSQQLQSRSKRKPKRKRNQRTSQSNL